MKIYIGSYCPEDDSTLTIGEKIVSNGYKPIVSGSVIIDDKVYIVSESDISYEHACKRASWYYSHNDECPF